MAKVISFLNHLFIEQEDTLARLNPAYVNTIRMVTFINANQEVEIWATIIRIGYAQPQDNFSKGGLAATIDIETGVINSTARVKDPFQTKTYHRHPVTNAPISGTKIPCWHETLTIVKQVALEIPSVRTVGWDIAITQNTPTLIEGNW